MIDLNDAVRFSAADIADPEPIDAFEPGEEFVRAVWFDIALQENAKLRAALLARMPEDAGK